MRLPLNLYGRIAVNHGASLLQRLMRCEYRSIPGSFSGLAIEGKGRTSRAYIVHEGTGLVARVCKAQPNNGWITVQLEPRIDSNISKGPQQCLHFPMDQLPKL